MKMEKTFKIDMLNFFQYETSLKVFTLLCCRKAALNHFMLVMGWSIYYLARLFTNCKAIPQLFIIIMSPAAWKESSKQKIC